MCGFPAHPSEMTGRAASRSTRRTRGGAFSGVFSGLQVFRHRARRRTEMKARLPLLLSLAALFVAVFGSQTVGSAAVRAGGAVVKHALFADRARHARFARDAVHATRANRAGKAKKADFAQNAGAVNTIQASRTPAPNKLLPLDGNGTLPTPVGAVGPQG